MHELVIISGKGGTGKTSLVGSLAALADNKIVVDCDVDAADLYLLLNNEVWEKHDFVVSRRASIDAARCSNCGLCIDYCRFEAVIENSEGFRIDPFKCEGCGVCRYFCPEYAIRYKQVKSGEWYISKTDFGPLVHARLGIAESNSGRLVSLLRQKARELAEANRHNLIIVDGPPGIGCPVIASVTGANYVLIVTEPSQSAFHDLKRLIELINHFKMPCGLVINKSDINADLSKQIRIKAESEGVKLLAELAYDPLVTAAQLAGKPFIKHISNDTSDKIKQLWKKIEIELDSSYQYNDKKEIL